jgi:Tol biopolymer transport system component
VVRAFVLAAVSAALFVAPARASDSRIVFSSKVGETQLWSVASDGSDLRQLTYAYGGGREELPSPDGRLVAFTTKVDENSTELAVGAADGSWFRIVARAQELSDVGWSSDGKWVSFRAFRQPAPGVFVNTLSIVRPDATDEHAVVTGRFGESDWSPSGPSLAVSDGERIVVYGVPSGSRRIVASYPGTGVSDPRWSPDGRRLAYLRLVDGALLVYDLPKGITRVVTIHQPGTPYRFGLVSWSPDGRQIAFSVPQAFTDDVYVVDANGGHEHAFPGVGSCEALKWSPGGTWVGVLWANYSPLPFAYLSALSADGSRRVLVTSDAAHAIDEAPVFVWSPDEREVFYATTTGSLVAVTPLAAHSRIVIPATTFPGFRPLAWSTEGNRLLLRRYQPDTFTPSELYSVDPGSRVIRVLTTDGQDHDQPAFSADGRRLAYVHLEDRGFRVVVAQADGSAPRDIGRGTRPSLSPSGDQVAFVRDGKVRIVGVAGGRERVFARGSWPAWSPDGRLIAFLRRGAVWVGNADGTGKRLLAGTPVDAQWGPPSWYPDNIQLYLPYRNGPGALIVDADGTGAGPPILPDVTSTAVSAPSPDAQQVAFETGSTDPPGWLTGQIHERIQVMPREGRNGVTVAETVDPPKGQLRRRLAWQPEP